MLRKNKKHVEGDQTNEWRKSGSFVNKPSRGWLHPDSTVMGPGVVYSVQYLGCIAVNQSMRTLEFTMRTHATKEAIRRVTKAAAISTPAASNTDRRKKPKEINRILADQPDLRFSQSYINLTISTASLTLVVSNTGQFIANHQMQSISFASGGDPDTLEYVAYVAKDSMNRRACHVLRCVDGLAQDVINTIGQAFELRFKEYLKNPPRAVTPMDRTEPLFHDGQSRWDDDGPEYYNDISASAQLHHQQQQSEPASEPLHSNTAAIISSSSQQHLSSSARNNTSHHDYVNNAFPSPSSLPLTQHQQTESQQQQPTIATAATNNNVSGGQTSTSHNIPATSVVIKNNFDDHNYVNTQIITEQQSCMSRPPTHLNNQQLNNNDMQQQMMVQQQNNRMLSNNGIINNNKSTHRQSSSKGSGVLAIASAIGGVTSPQSNFGGVTSSNPNFAPPPPSSFDDFGPFKSGNSQHTAQSGGEDASIGGGGGGQHGAGDLEGEVYYHGVISRRDAEALLRFDGDFLVRQSSSGGGGQFVLSGLKDGQHKHLLLVDPSGVVRTKDRIFESVTHLISYHRSNNLPIISSGSILLLRQPVHPNTNPSALRVGPNT